MEKWKKERERAMFVLFLAVSHDAVYRFDFIIGWVFGVLLAYSCSADTAGFYFGLWTGNSWCSFKVST